MPLPAVAWHLPPAAGTALGSLRRRPRRRIERCACARSRPIHACLAASQSVANTLKRALLIWLSILYFGNPVTWLSGFGTIVCIGGVFAYNHARRRYPYRDEAETAPLLPVHSPTISEGSSSREPPHTPHTPHTAPERSGGLVVRPSGVHTS